MHAVYKCRDNNLKHVYLRRHPRSKASKTGSMQQHLVAAAGSVVSLYAQYKHGIKLKL